MSYHVYRDLSKARLIWINDFTRKKNERVSNSNCQNDGISNYGSHFFNNSSKTRNLQSRQILKTKSTNCGLICGTGVDSNANTNGNRR